MNSSLINGALAAAAALALSSGADAATLHALGADGKLRAIDTESRKAAQPVAIEDVATGRSPCSSCRCRTTRATRASGMT